VLGRLRLISPNFLQKASASFVGREQRRFGDPRGGVQLAALLAASRRAVRLKAEPLPGPMTAGGAREAAWDTKANQARPAPS